MSGIGSGPLERRCSSVRPRNGQVGAPVGLPRVRDRYQVLVPDLAGRPGLVHEPPPERLVGRQLGPKDLERDLLALRFADRAVDDAHPAFAQALLESVGPEAPAGFELGHVLRIAGAPAPVGGRYDDRT
jgi:hypothetical protein